LGIEIDRTAFALYDDPEVREYLPSRGTYELRYDEARSALEHSSEQFDVIAVGVETVNSVLKEYVDESTSLVYSVEALSAYLDRLNGGGYLLLLQYSPHGPIGDAMANKLLGTLEEALPTEENLSDHTIVYSSALSRDQDAQRFIVVAYRDDGFSERDVQSFMSWKEHMESFSQNGSINPFVLTLLHLPPNAVTDSVTYTPYFNEEERTTLAGAYNTDIITDDKPFRHLVTPTPFPPSYYAFFLAFLAALLLVLGRLKRSGVWQDGRLVLLSAAFGILTFGLQYLLFYKTAAFLNTNLIFFAVFLLIPLFFSSLGGFAATYLKERHMLLIAAVFLIVSLILASMDVFSSTPALIFSMIAILFVVSGILFPRVLARSTLEYERTVIYAVNVAAGGFAFILMITFHATFGWLYTFIAAAILISLSMYALRR
jgi:hypothetical protein